MKKSHMSFSPLQFPSSIKKLVSLGLYPQALKASIDLLDLRLSNQIYALFTKSGFLLDIFLGSSLIDRFSKAGDLHHAHCFLLDMPEADTVAWNTLISGFARIQQTKPAFSLFDSLRFSGLKPDNFTLSSLIKACNIAQENEIAHVVALKMGFISNAFISSGLIDNYSKFGEIGSAKKCFEECLIMDTVVWTAMLSGYLWNGEVEMAKRIFMEMRVLGTVLNQFSLTSVLGTAFEIKEGEVIHGLSVKMGFLDCFSTPLRNAIMSMYCRCGSKTDGIKMFDEISDPDVISWTIRIGAAFDGEEALELFRFLCSRDVEINEYTLIHVLSAIGSSRLLKPGKQIQAHCCKAGYLSVISVGNALISMYGKCHRAEEARGIFDEMHHRDCVSWNALIAGYAENGLAGSALGMFSKMRQYMLEPTKFTLASVLEVISNSEASEQAKEIHAHIIKSGFASDDSMVTSLITTYEKCCEIENSKQIFFEIDEIDVLHVNAMAATFVQSHHYMDVLKLFQDTWDSNVEVDDTTFSIALKACAALTILEQGKSIHSLALKYGINQDTFAGSAIIDVYCKCGSIDDAKKAFNELPNYNLAAWNAMIMGYAQHGNSKEVFKLFDEMPILGMDPDEITYIGVLYSCCHSGLVKQACSILNSMFDRHGVTPQLEHYACVIDLLGRVGNLEEAKRCIDQMPISPDAHIWQILLSACNIHGNVELGKVVAQKLLELQPKNDSAYVLLSNLYALAGMWDEVGRLRKVMQEKTITKEPGASWIQVRGVLHSFFSNDSSHFESSEIYFKLQELNKQMIATTELKDMVFDSYDS